MPDPDDVTVNNHVARVRGVPVASANVSRDRNGTVAGASAQLGQNQVGDANRVQLVAPGAQAQIGRFQDGDGNTTTGVNLNANTVRLQRSTDNGGVGGTASGPDASLGATHNRNVTQAGAQANIVSGDVSARQSDPNRGDDVHARFGLSLGVGAAGRLHHSDRDGDGVPELGFGFDFGPVSMDFSTELFSHGVGDNTFSDIEARQRIEDQERGRRSNTPQPSNDRERRHEADVQRRMREQRARAAQRQRDQEAAARAQPPSVMSTDTVGQARAAEAAQQRAATYNPRGPAMPRFVGLNQIEGLNSSGGVAREITLPPP